MRQVAHALLVFDARHALIDRVDDALERAHGGDRLAQLNVTNPHKELRFHEVRAVAPDAFEQSNRLFELALGVLVTTEHVVELPEQLALLRVVEALDLLA